MASNSGTVQRSKLIIPRRYILRARRYSGRVQRMTGDKHLAGMRRRSLAGDLLWRSKALVRQTATRRQHRIPSWSWAAVDGAKTADWCDLVESRDQGFVVHCTVNVMDDRLPFANIDGGCLILKGRLKTLTLSEARTTPEQAYWCEISPDYTWWLSEADADSIEVPHMVTFFSVSYKKEVFGDDTGLVLVKSDRTYERVGAYKARIRGEEWVLGFEEDTIHVT